MKVNTQWRSYYPVFLCCPVFQQECPPNFLDLYRWPLVSSLGVHRCGVAAPWWSAGVVALAVGRQPSLARLGPHQGLEECKEGRPGLRVACAGQVLGLSAVLPVVS